jgi:putative Ca2+/H+ antiporter (TMEM165/GDT1 family)
MLAAHYGRALPIILGITLATALNHLASAWLGQTIGVNFNSPQFSLLIGVVFIAIGLWLLKPDTQGFISNKFLRFSPFVASFIAFFLAEIGDKTQFATIALASEYQALLWVTLGTTIGMLIANIPAIFLGEAFISKIPMKFVRNLASIAFVGFGIFQIFQAF